MIGHLWDPGAGQYRPLPAGAPQRYPPAVIAAYGRYADRQRGLERADGRWDLAGRWAPAAGERQACCERIRPPSRRWPQSLWRHAHTAGHVAALCGVPAGRLRSLIAWSTRYWQPARTAPRDLCRVCGASWACEHHPWTPPAPGGRHPDDADLWAVPDHRADMRRHLGPGAEA